jgi:beta-lactamase superfamily II metal-dependent hydrolase
MVPYLLRRGVRTIDALIITHPDLDHFGGARSVIEMLHVITVYDPGVPVAKSTYDDLLHAAARRGTRWQKVRSGSRLDFDGVTMLFLHPDTVLLDASQDANDYSAVFRLEFGRFSGLFTGDVSTDVEAKLGAQFGDRLDVDLLKVGHHGSSTSTGADFLTQATPDVALISVGRRNHYRHPSPRVLERLETAGVSILRTDLQGNITVRIQRNGRIEAWTKQ